MKIKRRQRYPRINCLVPGCKRGTTTVPPNFDGSEPEIICDPHWRTVPLAWRKRLTLYRRKYSRAAKIGDAEKMDVAARCWWRRWEAIKRLFVASAANSNLEPLMAEQLRKDGLL